MIFPASLLRVDTDAATRTCEPYLRAMEHRNPFGAIASASASMEVSSKLPFCQVMSVLSFLIRLARGTTSRDQMGPEIKPPFLDPWADGQAATSTQALAGSGPTFRYEQPP